MAQAANGLLRGKGRMKTLTFDTFIQDPANQNAFDVCSKLARFDASLKSPIVLLGDSGSGKTHLLWALVNHYRAGAPPVGIALISPSSFPDVVKQLASRPEKLTADTPVVLLVDDLHAFDRTGAGDLEKVLFALHEHGHHAILATHRHPTLIPALSGKCKALLNDGVIVGIKPAPGLIATPKESPEHAEEHPSKPETPPMQPVLPEAVASTLRAHADGVLQELREFLYAWDLHPPLLDTRDKNTWSDSGARLQALAATLDGTAQEILQACGETSPAEMHRPDEPDALESNPPEPSRDTPSE